MVRQAPTEPDPTRAISRVPKAAARHTRRAAPWVALPGHPALLPMAHRQGARDPVVEVSRLRTCGHLLGAPPHLATMLVEAEGEAHPDLAAEEDMAPVSARL